MDNIRRMSSQTSSLAHWRKRLCTVFQGPNSGCKSRQGAPVFMSHRMALNIRRSSLRLRPLVSVRGFTSMAQLWPIFRLKCRVCSCQTSKQQKDEKSRTYLETAPSGEARFAAPKMGQRPGGGENPAGASRGSVIAGTRLVQKRAPCTSTCGSAIAGTHPCGARWSILHPFFRSCRHFTYNYLKLLKKIFTS